MDRNRCEQSNLEPDGPRNKEEDGGDSEMEMEQERPM